MARPLQLPYGLTTFKEGSLRAIDQEKIAAFERATPKKTAYDKAREEANAKKKREEEETRVIYEDFVKSFDDGSGEYNIKSLSPNSTRGISCSKRHFAESSSNTEAGLSRKRNLDNFLEEIKSIQQKEILRIARTTNTGIFSMEKCDDCFDSSHPRSLHLTSLPPSTTQQSLSTLLLPYGKITSINILPSKSTDDQFKKGVSAFVTFEDPKNAEKAKSNIDGTYIGEGWRVKAVWGKELKSFTYVDSHKTKLPFDAKQGIIGFNRAPPPGGVTNGRFNPLSMLNRIEVVVSKPKDLKLLRRIHRVIEKIIEHGVEFEAFLMKREYDNPDYEFLFDSTTSEHIYYRWKLFSLLNGDFPYKWSKEPFQMFTNEAWWVPPENTDDGDDEFADDISEKRKQMTYLGSVSRSHFDWLLREISYRRGNIARAMSFAIEHANAADEIVEILISSLIQPHVPISTKIARLYLVSDILHNSSIAIPNVWKYRQLLEQNLGVVFKHFSEIYKSFDGRIKADNFRRQVVNITSAWESWIVFGQGVLENFLEIFLGNKEKSELDEDFLSNDSKFNKSSQIVKSNFVRSGWKRITDNLTDDRLNIDYGLSTQESENTIKIDNLDSQKKNDTNRNFDNKSIENLDDEPMENLDGEPMENLDGEPMENLDGGSTKNLDDKSINSINKKSSAMNDCNIAKNVSEEKSLFLENSQNRSIKFDFSKGKSQVTALKSSNSFNNFQDKNLDNFLLLKTQSSDSLRHFPKRMKASDGFGNYNLK
ncbi:hypothetical protein PNEG_03341 [Pneumocystis murina B123]|uniref:U2 snRNP-associated SURP motif-containing protein n=1 Tax=Pneumocystis murina (strain B123) TaxID=1069680 RepID=M7NLU6_PNEMU|nr:hypothetical protein PNEG_03341 [Pneumocystis murina B123]EMR08167.1 hypothetical protein PNEG_03341 [Pneumocystis murina B123]